MLFVDLTKVSEGHHTNWKSGINIILIKAVQKLYCKYISRMHFRTGAKNVQKWEYRSTITLLAQDKDDVQYVTPKLNEK